jgi:dTDP-4-amino-4,6-dideoxygalactose transaminase
VHQFSYYREQYSGIKLPITEDVAAREVTLPLYPTMSDEQVDLVIAAVLVALDTLS